MLPSRLRSLAARSSTSMSISRGLLAPASDAVRNGDQLRSLRKCRKPDPVHCALAPKLASFMGGGLPLAKQLVTLIGTPPPEFDSFVVTALNKTMK